MSNTEKSLIHETIIITGASRGIGQATAHQLAAAGAHVVLGARNMDQLNAVVDAIKSKGGKATAMELDVSKRESCEEFINKTRDQIGIPTVLINNAGIGTFRPIEKFQPDEFEEQFRVNVFGTFYMTHFSVPLMKENGRGHIVNVSSLAGKNAAPMGSGYFATKWAVNGFSQSLFQDVRQHNIRVTTVCPGSVDTRFHLDSHPGSHPKDQSWMVQPRDVANTIHHVITLPENCTISEIEVRPTNKAS